MPINFGYPRQQQNEQAATILSWYPKKAILPTTYCNFFSVLPKKHRTDPPTQAMIGWAGMVHYNALLIPEKMHASTQFPQLQIALFKGVACYLFSKQAGLIMDTNHLEQLLKSRDISPTAMRLLVLNELVASKVAVSMLDLESAMERSDKVTIYRTLKTFQKQKLVHSIDDGTGSVKYALCAEDCECSPADFHAHFHCNVCNGTFCLNDYMIPPIGLPVKFKLEEMSIVLKGKCESCSQKQ